MNIIIIRDKKRYERIAPVMKKNIAMIKENRLSYADVEYMNELLMMVMKEIAKPANDGNDGGLNIMIVGRV